VQKLEGELAARWNMPADEACLLAHLSGGRVGTALDLHEHPEKVEHRRTWQEDALNLLEAPYRDRLKYSESINPKPVDREKLRQIFSAWLSMWRDLMLASSGANIPLVNLDLEADLKRAARQVGAPAARACTAALEKSLAGLDANLNTQLLTDTILLDWPKV